MADIIDFAFYKQFGVILFGHRASYLKKKNTKEGLGLNGSKVKTGKRKGVVNKNSSKITAMKKS